MLGILSETWILPLIVEEEAKNYSIISDSCSCVGGFSHLFVHSTSFIKSIVGAGVSYSGDPAGQRLCPQGAGILAGERPHTVGQHRLEDSFRQQQGVRGLKRATGR